MKHVAEAIALGLLVVALSYCSIQHDKNEHEERMWCLSHGGIVTGWGVCKGMVENGR